MEKVQLLLNSVHISWFARTLQPQKGDSKPVRMGRKAHQPHYMESAEHLADSCISI